MRRQDGAGQALARVLFHARYLRGVVDATAGSSRQAGVGLNLQSSKASGQSLVSLLGQGGRLFASPSDRCSPASQRSSCRTLQHKLLLKPLAAGASCQALTRALISRFGWALLQQARPHNRTNCTQFQMIGHHDRPGATLHSCSIRLGQFRLRCQDSVALARMCQLTCKVWQTKSA